MPTSTRWTTSKLTKKTKINDFHTKTDKGLDLRQKYEKANVTFA